MTKFDTERHEHAAQVIAAAFPHHEDDPTSYAVLNALIHALLIHEKHRGLRIPGYSGEDKNAEAFQSVRDRALMLVRGCKDSWDGWEFDWEHYADALLRHVEATYTYVMADLDLVTA